jgi:hypothetical protein
LSGSLCRQQDAAQLHLWHRMSTSTPAQYCNIEPPQHVGNNTLPLIVLRIHHLSMKYSNMTRMNHWMSWCHGLFSRESTMECWSCFIVIATPICSWCCALSAFCQAAETDTRRSWLSFNACRNSHVGFLQFSPLRRVSKKSTDAQNPFVRLWSSLSISSILVLSWISETITTKLRSCRGWRLRTVLKLPLTMQGSADHLCFLAIERAVWSAVIDAMVQGLLNKSTLTLDP